VWLVCCLTNLLQQVWCSELTPALCVLHLQGKYEGNPNYGDSSQRQVISLACALGANLAARVDITGTCECQAMKCALE
jgi:hypothetical protein